MKRNARPVARACVLLVALWLSPGLGGCSSDEGPPDRIVLIVVDTLRRDHVSPYGAAVVTPNVQRLADGGQVFRNAVASFHQTTMSMAALFTGRTPSLESGDTKAPLAWTGRNWCGLARFAAGPDDSCVPQALTTLAEDLRGAGYFTVGVVSNRFLFRPSGYDQGFDEWIEVAADEPDQIRKILSRERSGARVHAALGDVLGRIPDQPLFLYVHYMEAHDYEIWDETYPDAVAKMDRNLGILLDRLEERGLLDRSVVFFTSDHGEILDERHAGYRTRTHNGNPSFQPVLEIPLIVTPHQFEDESRMIRSADIGDLIRRVAGVEVVPDSAAAVEGDEHFLSEMSYLTYRKGRFKSVFHRKRMRTWALFDLEADPDERVNLIESRRDVSERHLVRVGELARELAAASAPNEELTDEDRARLRALGYLDE